MKATLRIGTALVLLIFAGGAGCTWGGKKAAYQDSQAGAPLEVPPGLALPQGRDALQVPQVAPRELALASGAGGQAGTTAPVARLMRDGTQRWLQIGVEPAVLWPRLQSFLEQAGFDIVADEPQLGIIQTDWQEDRSSVPKNFLSRLLPKLYHSGEMDAYRIRVEQGDTPATSNVYLTHRGMVQDFVDDVGARDEGVRWRPRPGDPEREAEMLQRLLVFLGSGVDQAGAANAGRAQAPRAALEQADGGVSLLLNEAFDRAWRWTGLALDRMGATVEDRNRSAGIYYVRPPVQTVQPAGEGGWFGRLFSGDDRQDEPGTGQYQLSLVDMGSQTRVSVLNQQGVRDDSPTARRLLEQLNEELQ